MTCTVVSDESRSASKRGTDQVGRCQRLGIPGQDPGDIDRNVPEADDGRFALGEIETAVDVVRMAVVPADEIGGSVTPRQLLTGNAELAISLRTRRNDHRVDMQTAVPRPSGPDRS